MKIMHGLVALMAVLVMGAASVVSAATVKLGDSYGNGPGGEFLATVTGAFAQGTPLSTGQAAGKFETFCLEKNENISFGTTYNATIDTAAIAGGVGGGNPDPLSVKTAFIYHQFITGVLAGYNYGTGTDRVKSANALQNVIWFLEDEITNKYDGITDAATKAKIDSFLAIANATTWTTIGDVRVMNLTTLAGGLAQSQLIAFASSGTDVPAPAAGVLAIMGLGLLGLNRRRLGNWLSNKA